MNNFQPQKTQKDAEFLYKEKSYIIRSTIFENFLKVQIERIARTC